MPGRHQHLLNVDSTAVLVVDVQEKFRPHIAGMDDIIASICLLLRGCQELGVPIAVSEQYPKGLGATVAEIAEVLDASTHGVSRMEKLEISSCAASSWGSLDPEFLQRPSMLVVGIEAHVCVHQTVHDALAGGTQVHVVADAVGSRDPWQRDMALARMREAGALVTSVEMALFELLACAGTPQFTAVQRLIKDHDARRREVGVHA